MLGVDRRSIDEILLEMGLVSISDLKKAWDIQRESRGKIEDILIELGVVTEKSIAIANATKLGISFVDLSGFTITDDTVPTLITRGIANRYKLLPIENTDGVLTVAMKDPTDIFAIDDLRLATALEIKPVLADSEEIEKLIIKYFGEEKVVKPVEPVRTTEQPLTLNNNSFEQSFDNTVHTSQPSKSENTLTSAKQPEQEKLKGFDDDSLVDSTLFKDKIGNIMVRSGVITDAQLDSALEIQSKTGDMIGKILIKENYISKKSLYEFLEKQLGVAYIDLENATIPEDVVKLVNENIARRHNMLPVDSDGICLKVAMSDPVNIFSIDDLRLATGMEIVPLLADEEQIHIILDKYYGQLKKEAKVEEDKKKQQEFDEEIKKVNEKIAVEITETVREEETIDINDLENAPIVKMVNIIFQKAVASGASDIHIEPQEDLVLVRYRIDGQLIEIMRHDKKILSAMVARVKIISGLNIAEKRIPQDGRITMKIENSAYDLRVSTLPTMFGEKIVIRIIDKEGFNVTKKDLGFFDDDLEKFDEILAHPHGIVLVTGPTGSGKSTTLYTALKELCKPNVNIMTVEDPVESTVRGVNQVQVNVKAGLTFASALRSFLRQDPDIIMVGEIRDGETAEIATRAAITGHLVLSTLHTNDAPSSISRMIDMGIEPFMISSSVVGVIAQRLVRRLCPKCKKLLELGAYERDLLNMTEGEKADVYVPVGCPACNNTGYKGRIAVYEIMTLTREMKEMIAKNVTSDVLKDLAIKNGMRTLRMNSTRFVKEGVTSIDEMLRIAYIKD